jgi:hypothetical protein
MTLEFLFQLGVMIYTIVNKPKPPAPPPEAMKQTPGVDITSTGVTSPIPITYGRNKVAGIRADAHIATHYDHHLLPEGFSKRIDPTGVAENAKLLDSGVSPKNSVLTTPVVIGHAPINQVIDILIDDQPSDNPNVAYRNDNSTHKLATKVSGGLPEASWQIDVCTNGNVPHPNAKKVTDYFTGIAYAHCTFKLDEYAPQWNNIPEVTFLIEGLKVQRWYLDANGIPQKQGNKVYSNNPAWCLLDYLTNTVYGKGVDENLEINIKSFIEAAAICDIPLKTAAGADAQFIIGGKINGDTSVATTRKTFECNITLDTAKPLRENIETILTTMSGAMLVWSGGVYSLNLVRATSSTALEALINKHGSTVAALTDDDLIMSQDLEIIWPDASTKLNKVTVHFKNEARNFKEDVVSWPVLYEDANIPISATSEITINPVATFYKWESQWQDGKHTGKDFSKYAFPEMFTQFGVAGFVKNPNAQGVTTGVDTYRFHALNRTGKYCVEAVCTASINYITLYREYPKEPGREAELVFSSNKARKPWFWNRVSDMFNTDRYPGSYGLLSGSSSLNIGYYDGKTLCGATRLVNAGGSQTEITLNQNEEYFFRVEISYTRDTGYYWKYRNSAINTYNYRRFANYNPSSGVIYGVSFIDYDTGGTVLWQTGREYYKNFVITDAYSKTALQTAKSLHDELKAKDGGALLEGDFTLPGVSTIYHAWMRAEELVRESRYSFKITFKYLVRSMYLEPGDVFTLDSATLDWSNEPIPLKVTSSSLDDNNVCTISATYLSTDLYTPGVNLPNFNYNEVSPIYNTVIINANYFYFTAEQNQTVGSPGTLYVQAQNRYLAASYEYAACYSDTLDEDGELTNKDASGNLNFTVLEANSSQTFYEVPPTAAKYAVFRVRLYSLTNQWGAPSYSILEGAHTLGLTKQILTLASDTSVLFTGENVTQKKSILLTATTAIDAPPNLNYDWYINGVRDISLIGASVTYNLPTILTGDSLKIGVNIYLTVAEADIDEPGDTYDYTDYLTIPIFSGIDSPPRIVLSDDNIILNKSAITDSYSIPLTLTYYEAGAVKSIIDTYTAVGTNCTAIVTSTGISITEIDKDSANVYAIVTYGTLTAKVKITIIAGADVITAKLSSDSGKYYINYTAEGNIASSDENGINFTTILSVSDLTPYTFKYYVDDVEKDGVTNTFVYTADLIFKNMPQTLKVEVKELDKLIAADTVTILGVQENNSSIQLDLTNPFQILPISAGGTVSMSNTGTGLTVLLGNKKLSYTSTPLSSEDGDNGTYNLSIEKSNLTDIELSPVVDNDGQVSFADYAGITDNTKVATITFSVIVKDFDGNIISNTPAKIQKLYTQLSTELSDDLKEAIDNDKNNNSSNSTSIPTPIFATDSIVYVSDQNEDGTTEGTINWSIQTDFQDYDGYVVCYTETRTNSQNPLTAAEILKSSTKKILPKGTTSISITNLGTNRYVCAFVFAYRNIGTSTYDALLVDTPNNVLKNGTQGWLISNVAVSHLPTELSRYKDSIVLTAKVEAADGTLIPLSDMSANLQDFNSKNNTSVKSMLTPILGGAPTIVYDDTYSSSGNVDFVISFSVNTGDVDRPLADIDGFALLEVTSTSALSSSLKAYTPETMVTAPDTVFVDVNSHTNSDATSFRLYSVGFDERKATLYRNVYLFSYRVVDKATYDKAPAYGVGANKVNFHKFIKKGLSTSYFFATDIIKVNDTTTLTRWRDYTTLKGDKFNVNGNTITTSDIYDVSRNFQTVNDRSVNIPITPYNPGVNIPIITYDNTLNKNGNIDYILHFKDSNSEADPLVTADDSIDGFWIVESEVAEASTSIAAPTAQQIYDNPNKIIISAQSFQKDSYNVKNYYVRVKNAKPRTHRTLFIVGYREVSSNLVTKKNVEASSVVYNNPSKKLNTYIVSDVYRTHDNLSLSNYTDAITVAADNLQLSDGKLVGSSSLFESLADFNNKNPSSIAAITVLPTNMSLAYDTAKTYANGNVDVVFTFNYDYTGIAAADSIDGFCLYMAESKTNGNIAVPKYADMMVDPISKFIELNGEDLPTTLTTHSVVFPNVAADLFRTVFIFPYREARTKYFYDLYVSPSRKFTTGKAANIRYFMTTSQASPLRSHANSELYQAMTTAVMYGKVAVDDETYVLKDIVGDFVLTNQDNMAKTAALTGVTFSDTPITFEGNKDRVDVNVTWLYEGSETDIDGFLIDPQSSTKNNITRKTIDKIAGYYSAGPSIRTFKLQSQNLKDFFNFSVIPYHIISEQTYQKSYKTTVVKDRIGTVGNTRVVFHKDYTLSIANSQQYSRRDIQSASQPVSPVIGDYWLNTNGTGPDDTTTTAGIAPFVTAVFNGTTWEPIDAAEFKLKGITQTYLSTTEPGNQSGYYWKNTSTSDVSGVKAGDTVYFNSDLGIWISTSKTISQSLYIGLDTAKPSNMLEGNLYLTSNIIDGGNKLYNAKNGTWVAFASFAAGEIGTSKPAKTLTVTRYLQLAKVITKTPQSLPVYYYRNTTSDAWSIASTYDKKLIKSTSIPNKV